MNCSATSRAAPPKPSAGRQSTSGSRGVSGSSAPSLSRSAGSSCSSGSRFGRSGEAAPIPSGHRPAARRSNPAGGGPGAIGAPPSATRTAASSSTARQAASPHPSVHSRRATAARAARSVAASKAASPSTVCATGAPWKLAPSGASRAAIAGLALLSDQSGRAKIGPSPWWQRRQTRRSAGSIVAPAAP